MHIRPATPLLFHSPKRLPKLLHIVRQFLIQPYYIFLAQPAFLEGRSFLSAQPVQPTRFSYEICGMVFFVSFPLAGGWSKNTMPSSMQIYGVGIPFLVPVESRRTQAY